MQKAILDIINKLELNLYGLTVLTEAASGHFAYTPIIAIAAGAKKVYAFTKDSHYGSAESVIKNIKTIIWQSGFGDLENNIKFITKLDPGIIADSDIITNIGFLRPIDKKFINYMKPTASVPLMCETWEHRPSDVDLQACRMKNIAVLGTNEEDPRIKITDYLGLLALKKMFEMNLSILSDNVLIIDNGRFGKYISHTLNNLDINTEVVTDQELSGEILKDKLKHIDILILCSYSQHNKIIIGKKGLIDSEYYGRNFAHIPILQLTTGNLDKTEFENYNIQCYPEKDVNRQPMFMNWTLAELGHKPVIDLTAAGLKVGELLARAQRKFKDRIKAEREAIKNPICQNFDNKQ